MAIGNEPDFAAGSYGNPISRQANSNAEPLLEPAFNATQARVFSGSLANGASVDLGPAEEGAFIGYTTSDAAILEVTGTTVQVGGETNAVPVWGAGLTLAVTGGRFVLSNSSGGALPYRIARIV